MSSFGHYIKLELFNIERDKKPMQTAYNQRIKQRPIEITQTLFQEYHQQNPDTNETVKSNRQFKGEEMTKMKLKDYMRLSCLTKRSNSKASREKSKLQSPINKKQDSDKLIHPKSNSSAFSGQISSKDILKNEITNDILKIQSKVSQFSMNLENYKTKYSKSNSNELITLCEIQRTLKEKVLFGLQQANEILKKKQGDNEKTEIGVFINNAKQLISQINQGEIKQGRQQGSITKMSPMKKLKYRKQQQGQKRMSSSAICENRPKAQLS